MGHRKETDYNTQAYYTSTLSRHMECSHTMSSWQTSIAAGRNVKIQMRHSRNFTDEVDNGWSNERQQIWSGNEKRHEAGVGFFYEQPSTKSTLRI